MQENPKAAQILFESGLGCVGCPMAMQETIEEGCLAHGMDKKEINELIAISDSRLLNTHWHDFNNDEDHLALGQGKIDFKIVFDSLDQIGYKGPYILEVRSHQDALTSKKTVLGLA